MYYIKTADKLTRTSVWLEKLEGGLEHLKEVIIEDKLGICDELEGQMQYLVDTYKCEWKEVVNDPERRKLFTQFKNSDETEPGIDFIDERGQKRPADWPREGTDLVQLKGLDGRVLSNGNGHANGSGHTNGNGHSNGNSKKSVHPKARPMSPQWVKVGTTADFPKDGGATIKYGEVQIAVFNFESRGEWYACQNMCPHKNAFVISRGIVGSVGELPKVTCPLHKKPFSLQTGEGISGEDYSLKVFPVKIEGEEVHLQLPPQEQLNALLATDLHCIREGDAAASELACALSSGD
jgi:nitrite reductase (NADH) large subunit